MQGSEPRAARGPADVEGPAETLALPNNHDCFNFSPLIGCGARAALAAAAASELPAMRNFRKQIPNFLLLPELFPASGATCTDRSRPSVRSHSARLITFSRLSRELALRGGRLRTFPLAGRFLAACRFSPRCAILKRFDFFQHISENPQLKHN